MTMRQAIKTYKDGGGHFFDEGAMRFFNSVIESDLIDGRFFITSERMEWEDPKLYTIREFVNDYKDIEDFSEFQEFNTLAQAQEALCALA